MVKYVRFFVNIVGEELYFKQVFVVYWVGVIGNIEYVFLGQYFMGFRVVYLKYRVFVFEVVIVIEFFNKWCDIKDVYLYSRGFFIEELNFFQVILFNVSRVDFVMDDLESFFVGFWVYGSDSIDISVY